MLEACADADLVTEITMQPVRRHNVDAAIVYSDIVVPLKWAGVDLDIVPGTGPVIAKPVRTASDVEALPELEPTQMAPLVKAIGQITAELGPKPLIGFAGAPFTVASYLVEGGPSKNHEKTKAMMYGAPDVWNALCAKLARITTTFLTEQITAGASAIQLFDSWAGALSERDYVANVQPHSAAVLSALKSLDIDRDIPMIHFGVGTGELLRAMASAGPSVLGVDFRVPLHKAAERIQLASHQSVRALQGNLDPAVLFADQEAVDRAVDDVLDDARGLPGHIFNLGHGVMPTTNPDVISAVVARVHDKTTKG